MPYVTKYRDVEQTRVLGYDPIPIHRPKFIYFEFVGLRISAPHWLYFGGKEVTKFVNTSYTKSHYETYAFLGRNSFLKNPGERYVSATEFPTENSGGGIQYSGATAQGGETDPLFSDANGVLKGLFYLQSNTTYNWPINTSGTELMVKDTFGIDKSDASSIGTALFRGVGQYENYWQWTEQEAYEEWENPPRDHNDGGNDNNSQPMFTTESRFVNDKWEYKTTNNITGQSNYVQSQATPVGGQSQGLLGSLRELFSPRVSVDRDW